MNLVSFLSRRAQQLAPFAPSDEEVCRRVIAGDSALYEVLMRRHNQRLYRAVRAIVPNEDEAEDVMQQAYVSAYTHLESFAGTSRFSTWLVRIGINEALARVRRSRSPGGPSQAGADEAGRAPDQKTPDPEAKAMSHELRRALEEAVDALPELYRTAFMLREVEGMSTAEAAFALDVSEDAVKQRLKRAKAMLQKRLYSRMGRGLRGAFSFPAPRCDRVVAAVFARISRG